MMDAIDSIKKDRTWNGWQEIADRHGCSISTAIRLMKSSGLPVCKPKNGAPFMLESAYLDWARSNRLT